MSQSQLRIGVLALQGTFIEHLQAFRKLGVKAIEVRRSEELAGLGGVVIPGGESTTITRLARQYELVQPLQEMAVAGVPFLGTCAGMIVMAREVDSPVKLETLELMDIRVIRNAFGRQVSSFEEALDIPVLGPEPFPGLFIRGPVIENVGPEVEIIARIASGAPVAARQANLLATAFHPELMEDLRLHRYFVQMIEEARKVLPAANTAGGRMGVD